MSFILDNLIAAKSATPMIIVMENGMVATKPGAPPAEGAGAGRGGARGNSAFEEVVINDLIPMVDATYRTLANREQRAIAGLSMGAGQAMQIGLGHLDQFAYIGSFSGGVRGTDPKTAYNGAFADAAAFRKKVKLLWMGAGLAEAASHQANQELARDPGEGRNPERILRLPVRARVADVALRSTGFRSPTVPLTGQAEPVRGCVKSLWLTPPQR